VRNLLNTRLLHLEQRRAREAAEAATAARDRVLSVVAHDLRNPLAAIAMDAEMVRCMLDEETHGDQFEGVQRIERIAHRMHGMIEDLLDVSRLERGTFAVRPAPCDPRDVLAEAEAMLQPLAGAKGVALAFEGPDALPSVPVDGGRVVQALSNLVGNALDFTPPGGSIRVTWEIGHAELTVRISDTGQGIPPEQLPLVFGEFWQGTSARRRSGIGLGLVITRAIVEGHGGRIGIESSVGAGTTVTFTLPRTAAVGSPTSEPQTVERARG
jgi:signal transduction histidine kinase